jgi:glycosyltransferase involved in cell wall biosynthesis
MPDEKVAIQPQGMYMLNPYMNQREQIREQVLKQYGIETNRKIVLGVGFGDYRKGVDLFIKAGIENIKMNSLVTYMWVGDLSPEMQKVKEELVDGTSYEKNFVFAGKQSDPMRYYTAADIYLLTSREDPFPTVVMEAMYSHLPVVAFAGGGGYVELIREENGQLVPMEDIYAVARTVARYIGDEELLKRVGENNHQYVAVHFKFTTYVGKLLEKLGRQVPKVSAVLPNYNYAGYLKKRINSILEQDYPMQELIILDDCSRDNSCEIIQDYVKQYPDFIHFYPNTQNAGNVFKQWGKGLKLAQGEYVWIAEADDLSDHRFLQKIMGKMLMHPDMVMCYSQSKMMDENDNITAENYFCYTDDVDDSIWKKDYVIGCEQELQNHMSVKNTIPNVSGVVFKNRDFSKSLEAAMQYTVAGDWRVYVDILRQGGTIGFVAESLNYHRRHTNSVTTDLKAEKHFAEICEMQDYVAGLVSDGKLIDKARIYRETVKKYLLG